MSFETTSNYSLYQKYKQIKESLSFNYKGIELSNAIASTLLGIVVYNSAEKYRGFILLPFLRIRTEKFRKAFMLNDVVFSTFFKGRNDYTELVTNIQATVKNSCIVPINPHKKSIRLNIHTIWLMTRFIFSNTLLKEFGLRQKLNLIFRLIYICHQVDELEMAFLNYNIQGKKYIPFNSSVCLEALITLFFNSKGVDTFHIFHGIFGRYNDKIANDIINGENITAKTIIAFGDVTRLDMINDFGHSAEKVFIGGNPKYPDKEISVKTTFKKCIVLNGFGYYDNDFIKLLMLLENIANETGIAFDIKPHPNSNILSYPEVAEFKHLTFIPKGKTVKQLFQNQSYDFAITFNTVTYYECMYYNLVSLRYAVNENLNFEGLEDRFADKETLLERIKYFKTIKEDLLNKSIKQLLIRSLGLSINNYDKIINS